MKRGPPRQPAARRRVAASIAVSTASALDELTLDYSHDQFPNACAMRICMRGCRVCGLFGNLEPFFFDGMGT